MYSYNKRRIHPTSRGSKHDILYLNALVSSIKRMRREGTLIPIYINLGSIYVFTLFLPSSKPGSPILIYNPGGPGGSGVESILMDYAPYIPHVSDDTSDNTNNTYKVECVKNSGPNDLTSKYNLLYLDFPGDTGYSLDIAHQTGVKNRVYGDEASTDIAAKTIETVLQMFKLEDRPIEFFGFSYAGKIWPLVGKELILHGYNVTGMALFSGYTDPILQEIKPVSEYLLYTGVITNDEYKLLESETLKIENLINSDPLWTKWREIQALYESTIEQAWDLASADTYDIKSTTDPNEDEEDTDSPLQDTRVKDALGISAQFHSLATTFETVDYKGFLAPADDALKFLADRGVFIFYCMGSLDGASLAKGTKDMIEKIFNIQAQEKRWTMPNPDNNAGISSSTTKDNMDPIILGKIGKVKKNVYYGVVIGTGHSFDTKHGQLALNKVMEFLYDKQVHVSTL